MRPASSRLAALIAAIAAVSTVACSPAPAREPGTAAQRRDTTFTRPLYGPTWTLVRLRGAAAPTGAGGRQATLIFYSGSERTAAGFTGCNRWSSTYTLHAPDSIAFTPPVSTKMACSEGMQLEAQFLGFIEKASRIRQRDSTLVVRTPMGDTAVFVARNE